MKIAFLLFGIVGGTRKYGAGNTVNYDDCAKNYKEKIFQNYDVDVFIHTWSTKYEKPLKRIYEPKASIFQPQIQFNVSKCAEWAKKDRFVELSRWYSTQKVIQLQYEYSCHNNINYDFIMLSRFDMLWKQSIPFNKLEKDMLYLSNWNNYGKGFTSPIDRTNNSYPFGKKMRLYQDLWIIGNQEQMNHIAKLYDNVLAHKGDKHSPHGFLFGHLFNKYHSVIKFMYYYMIDYNLYRRQISGNWN